MATHETVVTKLKAALAAAQAPASTRPPKPPQSGIAQYLLWDDGVRGPRGGTFSHQLNVYWENYDGDWLDAGGVEQGSRPFVSVHLPANMPAGAYVDIDVTALAQRWAGDGNKGFRLALSHGTSNSASVIFGGRESANPPRLIVGGREYVGMLASWSIGSLKGIDSRQEARLAKNMGLLGRFDEFVGPVSAAILRLFIVKKSMSHPMTCEVFETNPPTIQLCGGNGVIELGVGRDLAAHAADIYTDCKFTQMEVWGRPPDQVVNTPAKARPKYPSKFTHWDVDDFQAPGEAPGRAVTVEFGSDEHGTYMRHGFAPALLGQGSGKFDVSRSLPDTSADPASMPQEMYCQLVAWLEEDFYDRIEENIKWGLGWDLRLGKWDSNSAGWTAVSGSGQSKGDGRKYGAPGGYTYRGHSLRMYTGASCRSDQGPPQWRNLISLNQAISHNGPYKFAGRYAHSALAGSEESQRLGNLVRGHAVVLPKDRPVAIEQFIKMNSVVGPFDALGNGTGLTDGALTTWVDGVKVDHRADLSWRRHPDWGVQGPWIVWYHGGVVPPGHVGHFRMYRMVVSKRYIGPIPKGNVRS